MPETHMHDTRYMAWHAFMCTKTSDWFPPPISLHLSVHSAADAGDVISSDFFFYFSIKLLFLLFNAFQNPSFSIQTQILLTFHPTQSSFNTPHTLSVSFSLSLSHWHQYLVLNLSSLYNRNLSPFQCDQMAKLFVQYLTMNNNENLHNSIKSLPIILRKNK